MNRKVCIGNCGEAWIGDGGVVYLRVNNCGDNSSRGGVYYGRVSKRTPLLHILYLIAIYVAPCACRGSTLYCTIFTVRVTGLITIPTAIPYSYMHTAHIIYSNNHVMPLSIGRGYMVKVK